MESPILKQIAKFLQDKKKYKRWLAVFVCLAVVVGFATTAALKMRGKAMTHDERVLNCKLQVHQHAETCYDQEKNIICGYADYVVHKHNDDCYDPHNGNLVCALPEVEAHQHTDECYQEQQALACGLEESEGHQHTEECRTKEQGELTCQAEEHTHTEECQAEDGAFSCGKEEHTHADECYQWTETLTCGQEESEGHHHTEACNQVQKTLVCQRPEIEVHTHGDECYQRVLITPEGEEIVQDPKDNTGVAQEVLAGTANKEVPEGRIEVRRSCGKLQAEEHTHTQENGCIEIREVLDGSDLRPVEEEPAEGNAETVEGNENPEGNPENGQTPMDGTEEEQTIVKTFEGDGFKVIAEYKKDANIPEEAELKAEQITAEDDAEHYAEREAEFRKNMENEKATMCALLKVGFYVNGQEVEPHSSVEITIQLLDEEGLPTGTPMTVVHFAESGTKKLDGSKAENNSTTFEMDGFSEIAVGFDEIATLSLDESGDGTKSYFINKDYKYKGVAFDTVFHIEGSILLPEIKGDRQESDSETEDNVIPNESDMTEDVGTQNETEELGNDEIQEDDVSEDETGTGTQDSNETVKSDGLGDDYVEDAPIVQGEGDTPEVQDSLMAEETENGDFESSEEENTFESEDSIEQDADGNTSDLEDKGTESSGNEDVGDDEIFSENTVPANTKEEVNGNELELKVKTLGKNSDAHKAVVNYTAKIEEMSRLTSIETMTYSLTYGNEVVDLSGCEVTATVIPKAKVTKSIKNAAENNKQVKLAAFGVSEDTREVSQLENNVSEDSEEEELLEVVLRDEISIMSAAGIEEPDPSYTVQYYAYIKKLETGTKAKDGYEMIKLIDTSKAANGGKVTLPRNGVNPKEIGIYVEKYNPSTESYGQRYDGKIQYKVSLEKIFKDTTYNFVNYPSIENINKFASGDLHYTLSGVWVWNGEGSQDDDENWTKYSNLDELEFTNNPTAADKDPSKILIRSNTVLRLVSNSEEGGYNNAAAFYDIDITDGKVYSDIALTKEVDKNSTAEELYVNTNRKGINSESNYNKNDTRPKYAFGNQNTAWTGLQDEKIGGFFINQASTAYGKCSFGIVSNTLGSDGYPEFNVNAPNIFSDDKDGESTIGKTPVLGYSLDFSRNGDTYTLSAVNDGSDKTNNLTDFWWRTNWNKSQDMWSNNFWALDSSSTFGTDNHDIVFGNPSSGSEKYAIGTKKNSDGSMERIELPTGDDAKDHNSYFTANFSLNFKLTEDYVGPLNYYFFGDDDMWVFLDNQLICDIGGVHPSAGEYVDLWDWIKEGDTQEHTLRFFYTERGASGSTCWMQFTLPAVAANPVDQMSGDCKNTLTVYKEVKDGNVEIDTDEEFEFTIEFKKKDGSILYNYFNYEIQDETGATVKTDSIKTGDKFKLKAKQSIIVRNLPDGAKYTIKEDKYAGYEPTETSGEIIGDGMTEGSIDWKRDDTEHYVNKVIPYELPETGGSGTILYTMAGVAAILLGAGFMYRKKFREGRVGGSS